MCFLAAFLINTGQLGFRRPNLCFLVFFLLFCACSLVFAFFFVKCYSSSLLTVVLCLVDIMRGGCKRFVAVESESFDLAIVGIKEDFLKISENGRGRRFTPTA